MNRTLIDAADLLENSEWIKGRMHDVTIEGKDAYCAVGAICKVTGINFMARVNATNKLCTYIINSTPVTGETAQEIVTRYNDRFAVDKEEVINTMRAAAVSDG
jgi:hypothetical protein